MVPPGSPPDPVSGEDADVSEGRVVAIFVAPVAGAPMERRDEVEALAGVGLAGDRYATTSGTYSGFRLNDEQRAVTLIEDEVITAVRAERGVELTGRETRRNLVTAGVSLNDLVDCEFRVGPVRLRGFDLAEPCAYLEQQTRPGVRTALIHRGGLRAEILDGGPIRVGDLLVVSLET
jgi:MOSC domain-containing protein YiiM